MKKTLLIVVSIFLSICSTVSTFATTYYDTAANYSGVSNMRFFRVDGTAGQTIKLIRHGAGGNYVQSYTLPMATVDTGSQDPNFQYFEVDYTSSTTTITDVYSADNLGNKSNATVPSSTTALPAPPAPPAGLGSSTTSGTSISLTWTGVTGTGITYNVYQNGTKIKTGLTTTGYTVTGLTMATSYQFYVTAVNSIGESNPSSTITVSTQSPPTTPMNLKVASVTSASVSISWDNSPSATGYNVYQNGTLINASPYPTNSYTINSLNPSTSYSFQVTAVNSVGESAKSASVTATTQAPPPVTLTSPSDGAVTTMGVLTWTPVSSNPSGTTYNVYRNGVLIGNTSSGTWTDTKFSPYASYTLAATYQGKASAPEPVSGSGIVSTSGANWGFQASDIWSNSVNLIVSISGFLLLILAVIFAIDIRFFLKNVFEKYRGRVKM